MGRWFTHFMSVFPRGHGSEAKLRALMCPKNQPHRVVFRLPGVARSCPELPGVARSCPEIGFDGGRGRAGVGAVQAGLGRKHNKTHYSNEFLEFAELCVAKCVLSWFGGRWESGRGLEV